MAVSNAVNKGSGGGMGSAGGTNLTASFGVASLVVVIGVLASWVVLKNIGNDMEFNLPESINPMDNRASILASSGSGSLLEQAELAFAAGRIIEPQYDNALGYYVAALDQEPDNAEAQEGLDRVISYLVSQAESALYQNDWERAREHANVILGVRPDNSRAQDLVARADRFERTQALTEKALAQFSAGKLVAPSGDNAADTYREILALDSSNSAAQQGLESVAQRLVANAQSAVLAGEMDRVERFIAQARELDPDVRGLDEVERSARQAQRAAQDERLQRDLAAASEALENDRLIAPAERNAYDLFNKILTQSPNSESAQRGISLVQAALIDRARSSLNAGNIEAAKGALEDAERIGASQSDLDLVRAEIAHETRVAEARGGTFDKIYSISELESIRQVAPEYPRLAASRGLEGWVILEFTVTETGEVRDATVKDSSSGIFDRAAMAAIDRWLFEPMLAEGRPVPVRATLKFSFRP